MESAVANPSIARLLEISDNERQQQELHRIKTALEEVDRSLKDMLHSQRMLSPRLFFLTDESLLTVLSHENAATVQAELCLAFHCVDRFEIKPVDALSRNGSYEMHGLLSHDGRLLAFPTPLHLQGVPTLWPDLISDAIRQALRSSLASALRHNERERDPQLDAPMQCVVLAERIFCTAHAAQAVSKRCTGAGHAALESLLQ